MSSQNLFKPVTDQGVLNTNFFEGRLLTGRDLRDQLQAHKTHDRYLGRAIGAGIIEGLELELDPARDGSDGKPPVVVVKKGLAINGDGDVIGLPLDDIQLSLSRTLEVPQFETATFRNCAGIPTGQYVPNGVAVYLLLMSPAAQYKESVPTSGLGDEGIGKGCGKRYFQEGVEFRLIEFPLASLESVAGSVKSDLKSGLLGLNTYAKKNNLPALSRLKNILANICFGNRQLLADRFDQGEGRDRVPVLDDVVVNELIALGDMKSADVPLCLFYWTPEGITFLDMWSVRRLTDPDFSTGKLRVYQFAAHLQWLLDRLGTGAVESIDSYFRFIPPAALVPERLLSDERGFRPGELLEGFYRGITDKVNIGQINRLLEDSFGYPSIGLGGNPGNKAILQLFTPSDLADLTANEATRRYFLYVSREVFRPRVNDDIAQVVADTWDVYRGLVKRQVFLPSATDAVKVTARMTIGNAIRDVLAVANRYAAGAATDAFDRAHIMGVFGELYEVQREMVEVLGETIPGVDDTQSREQFADNINHILTVNTPPGNGPSYRAAVENDNLYAALDSQIEINRFVGQWSGEGVAVGPFSFSYAGSPEGVDLVPGEAATPHQFTLTNGTNRSLEFQLGVQVTAPSGDWSNSATILRTLSGNEINRITLASGESATIVVMIAAPLDALFGDPVTIRLSAEVGSPTNRSNTYENADLLKVSEEPGEPVTGTVTIDNYEILDFAGQPVDREDLNPGDFIFLRMGIRYEIQDVEETDFAVDILLQTDSHDNWEFFNPAGNTPLEENPPNTYTVRLNNLSGNSQLNTEDICSIRVPTGGGPNTISFRLRVRTVELEEEVAQTHEDTVSLTVSSG